jgi:hypothetical protein
MILVIVIIILIGITIINNDNSNNNNNNKSNNNSNSNTSFFISKCKNILKIKKYTRLENQRVNIQEFRKKEHAP